MMYAVCSLLSDAEYGIGLRTGEFRYFVASSRLFPLIRTRRSAPGYAAIIGEDVAGIPWIEEALRHDPNAPDLWYGLARMQLKAGDEAGYSAAVKRLKELTPGLEYAIVRTKRG
jgi:predicted Zn-dependent protease